MAGENLTLSGLAQAGTLVAGGLVSAVAVQAPMAEVKTATELMGTAVSPVSQGSSAVSQFSLIEQARESAFEVPSRGANLAGLFRGPYVGSVCAGLTSFGCEASQSPHAGALLCAAAVLGVGFLAMEIIARRDSSFQKTIYGIAHTGSYEEFQTVKALIDDAKTKGAKTIGLEGAASLFQIPFIHTPFTEIGKYATSQGFKVIPLMTDETYSKGLLVRYAAAAVSPSGGLSPEIIGETIEDIKAKIGELKPRSIYSPPESSMNTHAMYLEWMLGRHVQSRQLLESIDYDVDLWGTAFEKFVIRGPNKDMESILRRAKPHLAFIGSGHTRNNLDNLRGYRIENLREIDLPEENQILGLEKYPALDAQAKAFAEHRFLGTLAHIVEIAESMARQMARANANPLEVVNAAASAEPDLLRLIGRMRYHTDSAMPLGLVPAFDKDMYKLGVEEAKRRVDLAFSKALGVTGSGGN